MQETKTTTAYRQSLRERILEVAMKCFVTHGVRAVKMDDIAQSLGISKRTLYEIYETKELLLFEGVKKYKQIHEEELHRKVETCSNVIECLIEIYRTEADKFRQTNLTFYSDIVRYPRVVDYLEANRADRHEFFLKFVRRGVSEGFFLSFVNYELVGQMIGSMSDYMQEKQLYQSYSFDELFYSFIFTTLRGICTLKGIAELDRKLDSIQLKPSM